MTRDTTFAPKENLDAWEEQHEEELRFADWFKEYFTETLTPSPRGGFEDAEDDGNQILSVCKSCGALVLCGVWYQVTFLNLHRTWHDKNDRSNADG